LARIDCGDRAGRVVGPVGDILVRYHFPRAIPFVLNGLTKAALKLPAGAAQCRPPPL
jgi:hypothetical protein